MKKRLTAIILVLVLTVLSFPVSASAASQTTISSFDKSTSLTYTQYDLLRTGKISAVKKGGVWYYQFTKNGNTLLVKTTAFSGAVGNDYSRVNSELTKGVMRTDGTAQEYKFTFKARTSTRSTTVQQYTENRGKASFPASVTMKTYTTYFSYITLDSNRVDEHVDLECKKNGHVQFVYNSMINMKYALKNGYKAPSTANEYLLALSRVTSNSVPTKLVPTFEFDITCPGTNCVKLNSSMYRGKGIADTKTPVSKYIEVAVTAGSVVKDLATKSLPFKNLFKLYSQADALKKSSDEYLSNKKTYLSKNGKSALKGKFTSPISLKKYNDYFRAEIVLGGNGKPSVSGTKTQMKVVFSMTCK